MFLILWIREKAPQIFKGAVIIKKGNKRAFFTDSFMVQSEVTICGCIPEEDVFLFSAPEKQCHCCDAPALTFMLTPAVTSLSPTQTRRKHL